QMILSCVKRMGERFGVGMTAKVLKGARDKKIRDFKLNSISTYGILSAYKEKELTGWIHFLIAEQIIATEEGKFHTLKLNKKSVDVLKGERDVWIYTAPIPINEYTDYNTDLYMKIHDIHKNNSHENK